MGWHRAAKASEPAAASVSVDASLTIDAPVAVCMAASALLLGRIADVPLLRLDVSLQGSQHRLELAWSPANQTPGYLRAWFVDWLGQVKPSVDARVEVLEVALVAADEAVPGSRGPLFRFAGRYLTVSGAGVEEVLLRELPALLERAIDHVRVRPDRPIANLDVLSPRVARELVESCCDGPRRSYEDCSVIELIERRARLKPRAQAVADDDSEIGYAELWDRSGTAAASLVAIGQGPGKRVGVLMERSIDWVIAILAVLRAGAVYVPLNPKNPTARNRRVVEQAGIDRIIGEGLQDLTFPERSLGRALPLRELEAPSGGGIDLPPCVALDSDAYCIFTSGSTGEPKGIRMPHRAFSNFVQACPEVFGSTEEAPPRHLQFCEPSFDVHVFEIFHPLSLGGTVVLDRHADFVSFEAYVQRIERQGVDIISPPTTFWHLWREQIDAGRSRLPATLRRIVVAGEMALPARFSLSGLPATLCLQNGYGPAETNYATAYACSGEDATGRCVPVGRPFPNLSTYVLDAHGHLLPRGAVGEICIGGAGVALGYVAASPTDSQRFVGFNRPDGRGDRIYRSGDLGYFDADGQLVCLGRADDQLKIQGVRVETGDVESHLRTCPGVRQAVVLGLKRDGEPAAMSMYLELAPAAADAGGVRAVADCLASTVPPYMVPQHYALVTRWPISTNGKVDRRALQALPLLPLPVTEPTAPTPVGSASPTLVALGMLWQRVRRSDDALPPDADLRSAEISSLRLGMFFAEVFEHFDLDVPPEQFFGLRTLREVAQQVDAVRKGRDREVNHATPT